MAEKNLAEKTLAEKTMAEQKLGRINSYPKISTKNPPGNLSTYTNRSLN